MPLRALLQRALEQAGYHALTAASGQEALDTMSDSERRAIQGDSYRTFYEPCNPDPGTGPRL